MADRSVKVTLRANVQDFKSQIGQASRSLDDLAKAGDKTGQASTTVMGRVTQSMQLQREHWDRAGTALLGFGTAITGVGVAALNTGISYNTLQQTSRAALTTITGSAEAANRQMDKLDEFASTSPFAKDVFIKAQQQMLGFGIEAQKVIPYMDAIQQSVAATGGSNQDISELSRIFSQVSASAKITATDLREFGNRGIDAATLIGSQMGMTGAEIRESITAGTLDAGEALDALAGGMQERFGGAADNVKNSVTGAFDRVKAAWRDLSGDLAAPLVGPDGGGLLVGLLNQVADLMRAFQGLPDPIKNTVAALGGIAGVGSLAAGGFMLLAPRVLESYQAFKALKDLDLLGLAGGLKGVAGSLARIALPVTAVAGIMALADSVTGLNTMNTVQVDDLADALGDVADGGDTANRALTDLFSSKFAIFPKEIDSLGDALEHLGPRWESAFGDGIGDKFDRVMDPGKMERIREEIRLLDDALVQMWQAGNEEQATAMYEEFLALILASGAGIDEAKEAFQDFLDVSGTEPPTSDYLPHMIDWYEALTGETYGAADAAEDLAGAEEELAAVWDTQIRSVQDLIDLRRRLAGESMSHLDRERERIEIMEGLTEAAEDQAVAFDRLAGEFDVSNEAGWEAHQRSQDWTQAMYNEAEAMSASGASYDDILARMEQMRGEYIDQIDGLQGVGDKAGEVADKYDMIPDKIATDVDLDAANALDMLEMIENHDVVLDGLELTVNGDPTPLEETVAETLGLIADKNGMVTVEGNTIPANTTWEQLINEINETRGVAPIDADDSLAQDVLHMFEGDVRAAEEFARINAIDAPGQEVLSLFGSDIRSTFEDVTIGGDDGVGQGVLARFGRDVDQTSEQITIGGNDSPGRSAVAGLKIYTNNSSASIQVKANTSSFYNVINGIKNTILGSATVNVNARTNYTRRAEGGYTPPGWTLVGEEGPELVNFSKPSMVYTAAQTAQALALAENYTPVGRYTSASQSSPVVNVAAPSVTLPNEVVLVDADGSLLTRARWIARDEYERGATTTGRWS